MLFAGRRDVAYECGKTCIILYLAIWNASRQKRPEIEKRPRNAVDVHGASESDFQTDGSITAYSGTVMSVAIVHQGST